MPGFSACFNEAQDLLNNRKSNDFYDSMMETADRVRNIDRNQLRPTKESPAAN